MGDSEPMDVTEPMSFGRMIEVLALRRLETGRPEDGAWDDDETVASDWYKEGMRATAKEWAERLKAQASSRRSGRGG